VCEGIIIGIVAAAGDVVVVMNVVIINMVIVNITKGAPSVCAGRKLTPASAQKRFLLLMPTLNGWPLQLGIPHRCGHCLRSITALHTLISLSRALLWKPALIMFRRSFARAHAILWCAMLLGSLAGGSKAGLFQRWEWRNLQTVLTLFITVCHVGVQVMQQIMQVTALTLQQCLHTLLTASDSLN